MSPSRAALDAMVKNLIAHDPGPGDDRFNDVALALFAHQFERNELYRRYCERRDADPERIDDWRQIPAVPTSAFKEAPITSFDPERAVRVFKSSGTTASKRSKHYLDTLDLYDAAIAPNFAEHVLPDGARLPMLILAPAPDEAPGSSLSYMLGFVAERFGAHYNHFIRGDRLLTEGIAEAVDQYVQNEKPICLLGTALAFVHWFEACRRDDQCRQLPPGSRAMETGGFKGIEAEITREALLGQFEACLGLPATHVVNEYGMAEMGTQFYDVTLKDVHEGRQPRTGKHVPHWARTQVVDPETLEELPAGQTGLLKHVDPVNRGSVIAIQTEDLGRTAEAGFELLGRAPAAEARGCSLALDLLLKGRQ
jgi:hypothetical protein